MLHGCCNICRPVVCSLCTEVGSCCRQHGLVPGASSADIFIPGKWDSYYGRSICQCQLGHVHPINICAHTAVICMAWQGACVAAIRKLIAKPLPFALISRRHMPQSQYLIASLAAPPRPLPHTTHNQGWGLSSLDQDAAELRQLSKALAEQHNSKAWVLMGHSTGCQDAVR